MPVVIPRTVPGTIGSAPGKSLGIRWLEPECLIASPLSLSVYGDPSADLESLKESIREQGILVPLVVAAGAERGTWDILSGHRRWACAVVLGLIQVPCEVREIQSEAVRRRLVLEYNRQRAQVVQSINAGSRRARGVYAGGGSTATVGESASRYRWTVRVRIQRHADRVSRFRRSRGYPKRDGEFQAERNPSGPHRHDHRAAVGSGRKRSLSPGPSYLADGPPRRCPGPERCGRDRCRNQDDPCSL